VPEWMFLSPVIPEDPEVWCWMVASIPDPIVSRCSAYQWPSGEVLCTLHFIAAWAQWNGANFRHCRILEGHWHWIMLLLPWDSQLTHGYGMVWINIGSPRKPTWPTCHGSCLLIVCWSRCLKATPLTWQLGGLQKRSKSDPKAI
jgi:hypothetical protein